MSQNPNGPNYNPYGPGLSNPHYPPAPGPGYNTGQPPSGPNPNYGVPPSAPNPNYGIPPSGPNPNYGQYAPPPPVTGPNLTPDSRYGVPPYDQPYPQGMAGPYDQTAFSQSSGATYPSYPTPSNPGFSSPQNYAVPPSMPNFGMPPTTPPAKKNNIRMVLISVIALLVLAGGVLGLVLYNNQQTKLHNDATATAQTQARSTSTAQAQASATISAQATATYVKTHYPFSSNLVLDDSLKDNSGVAKSGWDVGSGCVFTNGAYEATESKANYILPCAAETTNFLNFTFEIQMTIKTGGTGAEGGVIFRANMSTDALYVLFLDTVGNYELDVRANSSGASTRTLKSGLISNFATGFYQVHTIGIVANGSQITVYVDQNQIATATDPTYSSGQIGVISNYGSTSTTVAYSNAKVWQL
jgi:Tfp pilus assembly protein PilV